MGMAGHGRPAYLLYHTLWQILDWVFPPTCAGCGTLGTQWCETCQQQVTRISEPVCPICGEPAVTVCRKCLENPPEYVALRSFGLFQRPLRQAIHQLKYKNGISLAAPLSNHLIELYNEFKWEIDLVTPVPLGARRTRDRGYNQSGMLGRPLAYAINKAYRPGALMRTRETRSQVGLSASERRQNVAGAFMARSDLVKGKSVLIIDDVTTTGSTISACAQALRQAGASAVYGLTLARALSASADSQADADDQPKPSHI